MYIDQSQYPQLSQSAYLPLMRHCDRARYAELLSPGQAAEMAAEHGTTHIPGWVLFAELSRADIELLTQGSKLRMRLVVQDFEPGLPVVALSVEAEGMQFIWAVPMWETNAMDWLRSSIDRGQFGLVLTATDDTVTASFETGQSAMRDAEALLRAATVDDAPQGDAHLYSMLSAGLQLMNGGLSLGPAASAAQAPGATPRDLRVMVAGRGANAVRLMEVFAASTQVAQMLLPLGDQAMH
ncbi:hypothetical protein JI742_07545 [Piscinibacter sp. Jin2]|uniref:Uncharacterized protein n=1 Tax=Aquariibacter lacus TaxID=2801332 RepID=A0A9X0XD67_9BURK|nr:hypothetical protein [Piscinibacter lacus]MBL0719740.1 hypothetical protein [Piscinibacter lacus]